MGAIRGRSFGASEEFPCPSRCACGQGAELGGAPRLAAPLSRVRGARGRPGSERSGAGQCPPGPNRAAAARSPAVPGAAVPLLGERLGAVLVAEGFLKYRATEECGRRMRGRCGLGAKGWPNPCQWHGVEVMPVAPAVSWAGAPRPALPCARRGCAGCVQRWEVLEQKALLGRAFSLRLKWCSVSWLCAVRCDRILT